MNILFCCHGFPDALEALKRHVSSQHALTVKDTSRPLEEQTSDAEVLTCLGFPDKITRKTVDCAPRLKLIHQFGVGLEAVDIEAASGRGIYVANTPGVNAVAVAEHTFLLMFSLVRNLPAAIDALRSGKWGQPIGGELYNKTLGIIGLGKIGVEVAKRASAFGMKVLAYDLYIPESVFTEVGAKQVDLESLLRESDIVSLHAPVTDETRGMIGKKQLELMKKTAYLINTGRGPLIDKDALHWALTSGDIRAAGSDVFWVEPPDPADPILKLENLVQTPHIAGVTYEAYDTIARTIIQNTDRVARGLRPEPCVNASQIP